MAARSTLDRSFLGRGWAFPPRFGDANLRAAMVETEQDIAESLFILLSTRLGERIMHPTYGSGLHRFVFETVQEGLITDIRDMIDRAIVFFEPRIELEDVSIGTERAFYGVLEITIEYRVRATNTRSNIVYPFYFKEGTDLP